MIGLNCFCLACFILIKKTELFLFWLDRLLIECAILSTMSESILVLLAVMAAHIRASFQVKCITAGQKHGERV